MKRHIAVPSYRTPTEPRWICHCGRVVIRKPVHRGFRTTGSRAAHGPVADKARYERSGGR